MNKVYRQLVKRGMIRVFWTSDIFGRRRPPPTAADTGPRLDKESPKAGGFNPVPAVVVEGELSGWRADGMLGGGGRFPRKIKSHDGQIAAAAPAPVTRHHSTIFEITVLRSSALFEVQFELIFLLRIIGAALQRDAGDACATTCLRCNFIVICNMNCNIG
ncbi:unnamed protein product, partial [Brenthis ino]